MEVGGGDRDMVLSRMRQQTSDIYDYRTFVLIVQGRTKRGGQEVIEGEELKGQFSGISFHLFNSLPFCYFGFILVSKQ